MNVVLACPSYRVGECCNLLCFPASSRQWDGVVTACPDQECSRRVLPVSPPTCASRVSGECKIGFCQHLYLQGEFQWSLALPADAFRLPNEFLFTIDLGTFQTTIFLVGLGDSETSPYEAFKRGISVSYNTLGPLDISPFAFSRPDVLEAHLSG